MKFLFCALVFCGSLLTQGAIATPITNYAEATWKHTVIDHPSYHLSDAEGEYVKTIQPDEFLTEQFPDAKYIFVKIKDDEWGQYTRLTCGEETAGFLMYPNDGVTVYQLLSKSDEANNRGGVTDEQYDWGTAFENIALSTAGAGLGSSLIWGAANVFRLVGVGTTGRSRVFTRTLAKPKVIYLATVAALGISLAVETLKYGMREKEKQELGKSYEAKNAVVSCNGDAWTIYSETEIAHISNYSGSGADTFIAKPGAVNYYKSFWWGKPDDNGAPYIVHACDTEHWPDDDMSSCLPRTQKCQALPKDVHTNGVYTGAPLNVKIASLCPKYNVESRKFRTVENSDYIRILTDNDNPANQPMNADFAEQLKRTNELINEPVCQYTCTADGWEMTAQPNQFCAPGYSWDDEWQMCTADKDTCAAAICEASDGEYRDGECMCGDEACTTEFRVNGTSYKHCGGVKQGPFTYFCVDNVLASGLPREHRCHENNRTQDTATECYEELVQAKYNATPACATAASSAAAGNDSAADDADGTPDNISELAKTLDAIENAYGLSKWRTVDGKFNYARLASDATAAVVLGTTGALVTSSVVKKKQVEAGFESLECTVGGQHVGDWGDVFRIDGK